MSIEQQRAVKIFSHLEREIGMVLEVFTVGHNLPLYGRLVAVDDRYIEVEKRDGRIVTVQKTEIKSVTAVSNQPARSKEVV
jgi:preprotein translocase subunit YajC